jgi:hypothetical protein
VAARIDRVKLELDVADEFEGRRTVKIEFEREGMEDPLIEFTMVLWRAWSEKQMIALRKGPPADLGIG